MGFNDKAIRQELDNQIGGVAREMEGTDDEKKKDEARRRAKDLVRRRSYHVDDDEIATYGQRKEALNFTQYLEAQCDPLYEVKGTLPKCPPGYRYSMEQKQCVPKTDKDDVRKDKGGGKDSHPSNGPGYNVWGRTGVNGDGYAWAEPNAYEGNYYDGPSGGYYNE